MFLLKVEGEDLPSNPFGRMERKTKVIINIEFRLPSKAVIFWALVIALLLAVIPLHYVKSFFLKIKYDKL